MGNTLKCGNHNLFIYLGNRFRKYYKGFTKVESGINDASQLFVHLKVIEGQVKYTTGFGWKKSGQFNSQTDWEDYLKNVTKAMKEPLLVEVITK